MGVFGIGSVSDDQPLPSNALTWSVIFHHDTHTHPFLSGIADDHGQFAIPTIGETDPDVWYRVSLDVTDSQGQVATFYRDVTPMTTSVAIQSVPAGAQLSLDGAISTAPFAQTRVVGINASVNVISTTQLFTLGTWTFDNWSDGKAAFHTFSVSPGMVLTAQFKKAGPSPHDLWLPMIRR